jgi:hypothetical protein
MSFLIIENQIKKQSSMSASPDDYLREIFTSNSGFKWILNQQYDIKIDAIKKMN